MIMRKLISYIGLMAAVISGAGCKKYLETLPDNRTVISTPKQVSQLLTSAYPHGSYMLFCEAMSDNVEDKGNAGINVDPQTFLINIQAYKYQDVENVNQDSPVAYWDSAYAAIAVANQALEYCNGPDSANYRAQKGEALLCRAYAHFMLVTLFAKAYDPATAASDPGIPYVTWVSKNVFAKYERGTVASVYQHIEDDLTTGLQLIQDKVYDNAPLFHFNIVAAHAFATRFYLFKRDYNKVILHAGTAIGNADPATLILDKVAFYNQTYTNMSYYYFSSGNKNNLLLQEVKSLYNTNYYNYRFGLGSEVNNYFFLSRNVTGGQYAMTAYGSSPQYFNFPKMTTNVIGLLSMEEVLFNRAEAYARLQNNAAAIKDLNSWVSKSIKDYNPNSHNLTEAKLTSYYGLDANRSLIEAVLEFKQVTFMQEGLRWLDILRLNIPVTHTASPDFSTTLVAGDKRRLLQLPAEVVNEGMALNPR
jgi:hypothetical protein